MRERKLLKRYSLFAIINGFYLSVSLFSLQKSLIVFAPKTQKPFKLSTIQHVYQQTNLLTKIIQGFCKPKSQAQFMRNVHQNPFLAHQGYIASFNTLLPKHTNVTIKLTL